MGIILRFVENFKAYHRLKLNLQRFTNHPENLFLSLKIELFFFCFFFLTVQACFDNFVISDYFLPKYVSFWVFSQLKILKNSPGSRYIRGQILSHGRVTKY